jgi:hypothetical protein
MEEKRISRRRKGKLGERGKTSAQRNEKIIRRMKR